MCVCDLGGVYIKPTRPWVVAPLPSSLATITLSPVSLCHLVQLTCSRLAICSRLVTWLPGHLVIWSRCAVIWSSDRVFASSRLRSCFTFSPIFCAIRVSLFARSKFISTVNIFLFSKLVSILSSPAPILQTRCTFCRDYSLSSY